MMRNAFNHIIKRHAELVSASKMSGTHISSFLIPIFSFLLTPLLITSCAEVSFTEILKGKTLPVTAISLETEPLYTGYTFSEDGNLFLMEGNKLTQTESLNLSGMTALAYRSDGTPHVTKDFSVPQLSEINLAEGSTIIPVTIEGFSDKANDNTFAVQVFSARGTINPFSYRVPFFAEQEMIIRTLEMEARVKTGLSDYEIARTETTFTLWKEVFEWANENGYAFRGGCGTEGSDGKIGATDFGSGQPVANVSLRDVRVWLNALSEKDGLEPVYLDTKGNALKDSTDGYTCDNATVDYTKNGWRLPTQAEYEFASRGGLLSWYAKSSGMPPYTTFPSESCYDFPYPGAESEEMLESYAVYNSFSSMPCASKNKNSLGLYDLSGNLSEWTDEGPDDGSGKHYIMGGSYDEDADKCRIDSREALDSAAFADRIGFRLARIK